MMPTMTPNPKLTTDKIYEIIKMKDRGVSRKSVVKKYGISLSTVDDIYVHSEEIRKQFESNTVTIKSPRKCISWREITDLERVLYQWFIRCKEKKIEITGVDIQRKGLELNTKLTVHPHFDANKRWLQNFSEHYHIIDANIWRYFPTTTQVATNSFKAEFNKYLQDEGYTLDNVYNVVYTPILWKAVPEEIMTFLRGKSTGNQKMCEDHITALFCANATGCHKLPVLVIGSSAETQSLYNFDTYAFSTIYRSNANAFMDSTIFNEWFEKHFLKSVKERQGMKGRREKTLLLLDNARSHYDLNDLNELDRFVTVMSIPLDATQLIQPIKYGIIACFKRKHRKELLKTLMPSTLCNTEKEVISKHDKLTLWDCCRIVHDAWSSINNAILKNAWDELLKDESEQSAEYLEMIKKDVDEILALLHRLPGCEGCNAAGVINWFVLENIHDKVITISNDEILQDFANNTLDQLNATIPHDIAGPSYS